jgi:hypothetical protein
MTNRGPSGVSCPCGRRAGPWSRGPDQLATHRTDAQTLGASDPASVRADDALLRSAAVTAADVLIVPPSDEEDPDIPAGGLDPAPSVSDLSAMVGTDRREGRPTRC